MPAATNRARVLVLAVMMCATAACRVRTLKTPPGLGPKVAPDACAKLKKKDLEAIREALIEYCETARSNCTDIQELRRAGIYLPGQAENPFPDTPLIGLWKCEVRDEHFVMAEMWHPPARTFFGVYLASEGGQWTVRKEFGGYELFRLN